MFLNINHNKMRGWVSVINGSVLHKKLELPIRSHLLIKSLMENFIFCAVVIF